ncbi:MAG: 30S ribosomal protein S20 [Nitrospirota bacterium]
MKRARQAEKRNLRNKAVKSAVKTVVKKTESAIASGNKEEAAKELALAIKALTRAASKGVVHKNTASRKISRLTKQANAISAAGAA